MYKNKNFFQVIGGWLRRMFTGAGKEYAKEKEENNNINDVEEIVSPGKQIIRNFMEKKLRLDPEVRSYAEKKVGKLDRFFRT